MEDDDDERERDEFIFECRVYVLLVLLCSDGFERKRTVRFQGKSTSGDISKTKGRNRIIAVRD